MNSLIRHETRPELKENQKRGRRARRCHRQEMDGEQSVPGFLKSVSEKSQSSTSVFPFRIYRLHICYFDFTRDVRPSQRTMENPSFDVFRSHFSWTQAVVWIEELLNTWRNQTLLALEKAIKYVLNPQVEVALTGLASKWTDHFNSCFLLILVSYDGALSEFQDLAFLKRGVETNSLCQNCSTTEDRLSCLTKAKTCTVQKTDNRLGQLHCRDTTAVIEFISKYMEPIQRVRHDFPLVGTHNAVDIYWTMPYDPLRNHSYGI